MVRRSIFFFRRSVFVALCGGAIHSLQTDCKQWRLSLTHKASRVYWPYFTECPVYGHLVIPSPQCWESDMRDATQNDSKWFINCSGVCDKKQHPLISGCHLEPQLRLFQNPGIAKIGLTNAWYYTLIQLESRGEFCISICIQSNREFSKEHFSSIYKPL